MGNQYLLARLVTLGLLVTGLVVSVSFDNLFLVIVGAGLLLLAALILTFWPELSEE